ncbi:MAG: ATP-binding protein [Coriobacteriia bacterium]|nr:ATP-binding protein [Coriobacteriia bacterium]
MQRLLMDKLIAWKNDARRKPLILRGARQVGKTWLLQEFGKQEFTEYAYVRLEDNQAIQVLFEGSLEPARLLDGLSSYTRKRITPNTLIVLDEIQAVPRALTALKYFHEEAPEYPIAVAGSLLGIALQPGTSFPVGQVDFLDLHPLTFREFLLALGEERLVAQIVAADTDMLEVFAERLTDHLKQYYFVGGMPEAVQEFISTRDYDRVRQIQRSILSAYDMDFSKHTDKFAAERSREVFASIPSQLAKANRKFVYEAVKEGGRGREYSAAIRFLVDSGIAHQVWRVAKPGMPLAAYHDPAAFKIYLVDIGLLGAMSDLDIRTLVEGYRLFEEFKGSLSEQFVLQELVAECGLTPYYWSAERSSGEVDFIVQHQGGIYPMEVKASDNLRSKSLAAFCQKYGLQNGLRLSLSAYRDQGWLRNIPLYAIGSLLQLLK